MWASVSGHLFLDARLSLTDLSVPSMPSASFPLESSMVKSCDCLNPERERSLWEVQVGVKGEHKPAALRQGPPNETAPSS